MADNICELKVAPVVCNQLCQKFQRSGKIKLEFRQSLREPSRKAKLLHLGPVKENDEKPSAAKTARANGGSVPSSGTSARKNVICKGSLASITTLKTAAPATETHPNVVKTAAGKVQAW